MKQARVNSKNIVVQTAPFIWDEVHPGTGLEFVDCPDYVEPGYKYDPDGDSWIEPEPEPESGPEQKSNVTKHPKVSPVEFKLLLTLEERTSLRGASEMDAGIGDLFDLLDDPRMKEVNLNLPSMQESIDYALKFLESESVVTDVETRKAEILSGKTR